MTEKSALIDPLVPWCHPWQEGVVKQLVKLQQQRQLPHAILIEMKTRADCSGFGWYLVSALLCQAQPEDKPCGECMSCNLMRANNYPDFTYTTRIEDDKSHKLNRDIRIEQVRRLIHQLNLTDSLNLGRFALIYPAERMNLAASNSLLKTLEEPASDATLILLSHHAGRLPVTIRSRCQTWTVHNPDQQTSVAFLRERGVEETEALAYLQITHGDPELALQLRNENYLDHQRKFSTGFDQYLASQIDIATLVHSLKSADDATVRQLIRHDLVERIRSMAGETSVIADKARLAATIELLTTCDARLQTSENNLNLLLQAEDVLISMKQALNKG